MIDVDLCPSINNNFFQSLEFYKILKETGGQAFLVKFSKKESLGHVVATAPDTVGIYSRLFPRFIVHFGPTIGANLSTNALNSVLEKLCKRSRDFGAISLEIRTPFPYPYMYEVFRRNGFKRQSGGGEFSVLIDLKKEEKLLWNDLSRMTKRAIKQAIKNNVEVRGIENEKELFKFYKMYVDTAHRRKFYPHSYDFFKSLWLKLEPKGIVKFLLAIWKNEPIGGILNTFYDNESVPYISCSLPEFWKFRPNHILFWCSIKYSKETTNLPMFKIYHLPGKKDPRSEIDYFTFKSSFGGRLVEECTFYRKELSPAKCLCLNVFNKVKESPPVNALLQQLIKSKQRDAPVSSENL